MQETIHLQRYKSPCGDLILGSFAGKLCLCDWADIPGREAILRRLQNHLRAPFEEQSSALTRETALQLDAYFAKKRTHFDLPLLPLGTDFQQLVWQQLREIPYGHTISYAELARRINRPTAVRAVASANRANALSILIPCHRVIGANHSLTGYAGGLSAKRFLLELESVRNNAAQKSCC